MKTYKYTSPENLVVQIFDEDRISRSSCIASILPEDTVIEAADPVPNPRIDEIKAELIALDIKRIRPLAEGDAAFLVGLNAQAVALRAELASL